MSLTHKTIALRLLIGVMLSLFALSCKQYEYASPLPGVLEIRLKVVNNRQDLIPFGPLNTFFFSLGELNGMQPGDIKQPIYADLQAIRRSPDGDPVNTLDSLGRDSIFVLGATYAPPITFVGLEIDLEEWGSAIQIFRNAIPIPNFIFVNNPPPPAPPPPRFFELSAPSPIQVNEGRRTVVTVTLDLDASLLRRTEFFELYPAFYISSVKNY